MAPVDDVVALRGGLGARDIRPQRQEAGNVGPLAGPDAKIVQVAVVGDHSAGLQQVTAGSGLTTDQSDMLVLIAKLLRNKQVTDPVSGKMIVYDDDGSTVLVEGALYEDVTGTTTYRGKGAERRERLS